jgi:hypothetical protein
MAGKNKVRYKHRDKEDVKGWKSYWEKKEMIDTEEKTKQIVRQTQRKRGYA